MTLAAVMHEVGSPLELETIRVAAPKGREVLVRPAAAVTGCRPAEPRNDRR